MPKTKISEFSATPANNTDIDSINIAEGCAPSGINDAIRELMAQLKDFQTGAVGDSFNGPVGTSTAAVGAFTTLSATGAITSTLATGSAPLVIASTTKVANLNVDLLDGADWAAPAALGSTTPAAVSATTLSASSTLSVTGAGSIQGLTVGRGAGAVSTNTAVGNSALAANTSGLANVGIGYLALNVNTTGYYNVAVGRNSLIANTTADGNTAIGDLTLTSNTTGASNVAVGRQALAANTTSSNNTAVGYQSLYGNTTGGVNSAFGVGSLTTNTTGSYNTAVGGGALQLNTTASNNTAVGYQAGYANTTGTRNTFVGTSAGAGFTTGSYNAAFGSFAMQATTSTNNTAIGDYALQQLTTGGYNTALGNGSGYLITTGSKNTIVGLYNGNQGGLDIRTASNYIVLSDGDGNPRGFFNPDGTFIIKRSGTAPSLDANLYLEVDASTWCVTCNHGFTTQYFNVFRYNSTSIGSILGNGTSTSYNTTSDYRLKENVAPMTGALAKVAQLKPCTYTWKSNGSNGQGFIAHELAEVVPEAVNGEKDALDENGKPDYQGIDTSFLVATLTAAIQEQQAIIESLKARLDAANL